MSNQPQFPIYIPSKGRWDNCTTPDSLIKDNVPFHIVVEPQEAEQYAARFGYERLKILPFGNLGEGITPVRNWCWEDSIERGYKRHWQIDDNVAKFKRFHKNKRIPIHAGIALKVIEDFTERYTNIGMSGMNYATFVGLSAASGNLPPFYLNTHIYSCCLISNEMPMRYRGRYNEDTDLNLQILMNNMCLVAFNAICQDKAATMLMSGGNTELLYQGDGRLEMARSLERAWPYVVSTGRRYNRPQHVVKNNWRQFDTQLIRRTDIDWEAITDNVYDITLKQVKEIKSDKIRELLPESDCQKFKNDASIAEGIDLLNFLVESPTDKVKYSVYIPSKDRAVTILSAKMLHNFNVPFKIVIEPQDKEKYCAEFKIEQLLVMNENDQGIAYARNFIKDYSIKNGEKFHWQIDDNIKNLGVRLNGKSLKFPANQVLSMVESVTDLYDNVGGSSIMHEAFVFSQTTQINVNRQVYTAMLLNNDVPYRFRGGVIEDTDYNMQMLTNGYCTLLFTQLFMKKMTTGSMTGGNTDIHYGEGGRLIKVEKLAELWPNKFKPVLKKGLWRTAPSRVWSEFQQRPNRKTNVQTN